MEVSSFAVQREELLAWGHWWQADLWFSSGDSYRAYGDQALDQAEHEYQLHSEFNGGFSLGMLGSPGCTYGGIYCRRVMRQVMWSARRTERM